MTMSDFAPWSGFCCTDGCPCLVPDPAPCDGFCATDEAPDGEAMPRCAQCGWPAVSHVGVEQRHRLRHPWHVEAALRAVVGKDFKVSRLHDTLRGDPRFLVKVPQAQLLVAAMRIPDVIGDCVLIEPQHDQGVTG